MRRIIAVFTLAAMLGLAAPVLAMGPVASPFDGPPSKVRVGVPPAAEKSFGDPTDYFASLLAGADYLVKMQADITEDNAGNGSSDADPDDGGWDWVTTLFVHSSSSSSTNLYGVTALGILGAYNLDPQPARFIALKDAADHIVSVGPAVIRSGPDVIFLLRFANLPDCPDPAYYRAGAQAIWDRDISVYVTMAALAAYIRDIRYAQGYSNGIIPWDIAFWVEAAMLMEETFPGAGHAAEAAAMAEVIYQDSFAGNPGYFDPDGANMGSDPTGETAIYWCYTLGLAGIIDAFAVSGTHTAELPALQTLLLACQYADGAFSEQYGATDLVNDRHWQSTAYAMMALYENLPVATTTLTALRSAAAWSISTQDDTGAWVSDSGYHYPEVGAENTSALVDALLAGNNVACVPDPRNLNIASPTGEVVVKYLGGASAPLFGFSIEVLWDPAVASATIARPDAGLFNNPTYFIPTPITSGALVGFRVDAALQGTETGILLGDLFKLTFTRVADGYGTTPIDITLLAMRDNLNADLLGLSEDDGLVVVDGTAPTVTNTFIANATLSHTDDYIKNTDHAVVTATVGDDDLTFGIANIRADLTVLGGGASVAPDGYDAGRGHLGRTLSHLPAHGRPYRRHRDGNRPPGQQCLRQRRHYCRQHFARRPGRSGRHARASEGQPDLDRWLQRPSHRLLRHADLLPPLDRLPDLRHRRAGLSGEHDHPGRRHRPQGGSAACPRRRTACPSRRIVTSTTTAALSMISRSTTAPRPPTPAPPATGSEMCAAPPWATLPTTGRSTSRTSTFSDTPTASRR